MRGRRPVTARAAPFEQRATRSIARPGGEKPGPSSTPLHAIAYAGQIVTPWRLSRADALNDAIDLGLATAERLPRPGPSIPTRIYLDALAAMVTDHVPAGQEARAKLPDYVLVPLARSRPPAH